MKGHSHARNGTRRITESVAVKLASKPAAAEPQPGVSGQAVRGAVGLAGITVVK